MMNQAINKTMTVPVRMLRKFWEGLQNANSPDVKNNTNIKSVTVTHNLVFNSFEIEKQF